MDTPQPEDNLSNTRVDVVDPLFFSSLIPLNEIFYVALTNLDLHRKFDSRTEQGLWIYISSNPEQFPKTKATCKLDQK